MKNAILMKVGIALIAFLAIVVASFVYFSGKFLPASPEPVVPGENGTFPEQETINDGITPETPAGVVKFSSEKEFMDYIQKSSEARQAIGGYGIGGEGVSAPSMGVPVMMEKSALPSASPMAQGSADSSAVQRYSQTNVQVAGIDEPDIVKTDGKEIYYSLPYYFYPRPLPMMRGELDSAVMGVTAPEMMPTDKVSIPPWREEKGGIRNLKAFPPSDLKVDANIEKSGEMILSGSNLVVFSNDNKVYGYDVSSPASPKEKWSMEIKENSSLAASRLYGNKLYVITQTGFNDYKPCPFEPVIMKGSPLIIPCTQIYHPVVYSTADSTYSIMEIDPSNGSVTKNVSFVGSSGQSVIYMSGDAIYVTYKHEPEYFKILAGLFEENADLFSADIVSKIKKLAGYDISDYAKMYEMEQLLQKYENSLDKDQRLKIDNEMNNRGNAYVKKHKREWDRTGIVKIKVDGLEVSGGGVVPGSTLNQFSLDEYQGNLRVAVTIGGGSFGSRFFGSTGESENDVYVLGSDLKELGSIQGLGVTERIYSARFIEDKGYLVTFRQTDPFYVLDLSNPAHPEMKGELKIPGFSSYLHPINKDRIIGVGQENWQVKISLFDVSNPASPKEVSKYNLTEGWTEVSNNHHAFLMDEKHKVFFLPGGQGGYIFSYDKDELKMLKAVSEISARRAVYINDYLYILSDQKVVVINENDWERVKEMSF
jgi:uncharacterized secreted protein with C-terminal beta-propeller domain